VRQPERDAGQGRRTHPSPPAGGGIDVRELKPADVERVDTRLPLHRLDVAQTYLIAWEGDDPIGHAHVAWAGTDIGVPEVQDVFVVEERRRQGVATALMEHAERLAAARGHPQISIGYGVANEAARGLYTRLGYRNAGRDPKRVQGAILIRGRPVEVDDTLVYLVKDVDLEAPRPGRPAGR
jgi:GNAT superfamily N-acetyltransferase